MQDLHITFFIIVFCYLFDTDTAGPAGRTCSRNCLCQIKKLRNIN